MQEKQQNDTNLKDYPIVTDRLQIVGENDSIHTIKLIKKSGIKTKPSDSTCKIWNQNNMRKTQENSDQPASKAERKENALSKYGYIFVGIKISKTGCAYHARLNQRYGPTPVSVYINNQNGQLPGLWNIWNSLHKAQNPLQLKIKHNRKIPHYSVKYPINLQTQVKVDILQQLHVW